MNKRVRRFILQVFSSLNVFFLTFQPLAALPVLLTNPVAVQAEATVSAADAVDLSFNTNSHEFQLRVKTDQALPYVLTYFDEKQDPQVEQAAQGNLEKVAEGVFGADVYAGTCSNEVCTPITFSRGNLAVGNNFNNSFQLVNGAIVFDGPNSFVEQTCVNPDEVDLTAGETLWSVDEATGLAETKTKVQPGVSYQFPLDDAVSVTFSCLPKDESLRSPLKIQQVLVSELNLPDSVKTDAQYAYDITTEMTNGSFEYELSLPKAKDTEVAISYIEKTIEEAKTTLSDQDVKTVIDSVDTQVEQLLGAEEISATGLDHFTIFVVVNPDETTANNNVSNPNNAWVSDSNYALYDDRDDYAIYGFPNLGVPTGATIEGVEVNVEGKTTGRDLDISLWNRSNSNPDAYTTAFTADLGSTESTVIVGSPTNLWGKTWTASDFDTNFKIRVDANSNSGTTASLDLVSVKVYYAPVCTNDAQGANDQPGQKDLTRMCINTTSNTTTGIEWNWDEINGSGNNSYDACSLYDTDSDGKANYATCVTLKGSPLVQTASNPSSPRIYSCGDTYADKCSSSILVASPYTTTCSVAQKNTDPFAGGDLYPADTVATCSVLLSEVGGANSKLLDVCSYPSQQPNSDPSDCIIAAGNNSAPTATPTSTPTSTPSPTPTETPTSTPTPTPTETPSPTPTSSPTPTATPTPVVCTETSWTCQECEAGPASAPACYGEMWSFCQETYGCDFSQNPNAQVGVWSCPANACVTPTPTSTPTATPTPEPGTVTIIKDTQPDNAQDFVFSFGGIGLSATEFSLDDDADPTLSNTYEITDLSPNIYDLSEQSLNGWTMELTSCQSNKPWDPQDNFGNGTASFSLIAGEHVTCTFTNTKAAYCGDGITNNQEQCDYGQLNGQSSCSSECTWINDCRETMVANNSFEMPIVSQGAGWDAFDTAEMAGWKAAWYGGSATYNGHDRPEPQVEMHRGVNGWLPPAGSQQYVELDTDWTGPVNDFSGEPASIALSQDIPTIVGNEYTVSWKYSARPNHNNNHLQVMVGGTEVFNSGVIAGGSNTNWQTQSYTFIATATLTEIRFIEMGRADSLGMFIDDIQVTCNGLPNNDVTVCKEDASGNPLSGWKVGLSQPTGFDQMIPVTNGAGVTTSLSSGAYVVYASGTYRYGNDAMIADAGNSFRPVGIPYGTGGWVSGDDLPAPWTGALEMKLSGGNISDTNINWGGFNSEHQYSAYLSGFEGDLNLSVWDNAYSDNVNNGGFRAKIDRSQNSGMTGPNGCVTFQDVPYGDYQVFEVGDKNWSYVSTTVGPDTITNYPATATVGDQVPEITLTNKFVGGGTIRIVKDVTPDDAQTQFDYTLSNTAGYSVSDKVWEGNPSGYVNLPVGTYTLLEVDLPGYVESISCTNNQTSQTNSITFELKTGDDITCTLSNTKYGSIEGSKYEDVTGNGIWDGADTRIGWTFFLKQNDQVVQTATTTGNQKYLFENLLPGTYQVCEAEDAGWTQTYPATNSKCHDEVIVNAGLKTDDIDFGNFKLGAIQGRKYQDDNFDGTRQTSEPWLGGWTIKLYDSTWNSIDSAVTANTTGLYRFENLNKGTYYTCEVMQPDWKQTGPKDLNANQVVNNSQNPNEGPVCWRSVINQSGQERTGRQFGNAPTYDIHGYKWLDYNHNGVNDQEQLLSGWEIFIDQNNNQQWDDGEAKTTTSGEDGHQGWYWFEGLVAGTYEVCEVTQTGWVQTYPIDPNCHTVNLPDLNPLNLAVSLNMVAGPEYNFGNFEIGDMDVWKYEDTDGILGRSDNETWIGDPTFSFRVYEDTNGDGAGGWILKATASTNPEGKAEFTDVFDTVGQYYVCEITKDGWEDMRSLNNPTNNESGALDEYTVCDGITVPGSGYVRSAEFGNIHRGFVTVNKFLDLNINGKYDSGEELMSGWAMSMEATNGFLATQSTETGGSTQFSLDPNTYFLSETLQDGWEQSNIYCTEDLEGTLITGPGRAYGHHGMCEGWNECGDAATCALKACQAHGYTTLVSYGDARPCTEFENCSLFYDINKDLSYEEDWGNWCPVMGVTDIRCGNYSGPTATPTPTPIEDADASSVIDRILGVTKVSAQPAPDPEGHRIVVTPGSNKTCYVGNYQPGSISGLKYFDENLDGNFDDGESKMQYWGISLSGEGVDEKVVTDENGGFSFVNLKKGTYTLCEEDRTAWGWQVTEPAQPIDKVCREVTIDQSAETEIANFGNFIDSRLYILKINNAWPDDVTIGDEVTYTIRVMAVGGPVHDANVFDVPPKQFTYVPDSYTAQSSDGTDLRANGTTGDPNYQSPGTWTLGDLDKDEIVTLTYKTKVSNLADPGVYPDMVWATGTSEQSDKTGGETSDLLALSDPEFNASSGGVDFDGSQGHFGEDNFAGTQVAIVVDQTPFSEFQVGRTEEKQGAVLGASTELPATGARAWLTFLALLSILAGAGLLIMSKRSRQSSPKLLVGLLLVGCSLWFAQPAQALTSVRIEEPYNNSAEFTLDAMTSQTSMKIDFVVLNTENISVTAQCQQQKNDGAWSNITTNYTVKAGGNSGYCEAKDLENTQNYDFRVVVSGDGPDKISDEVRVGLDTTHPDKPVNYSKNPGNFCEDKIGFKTANDGQTTSVEVYRSTDSDHFTAKPETRVITIPIGPNQEYTLTTSKPNCDDTYFYVIRAFDVNGNASDMVGDQEIKTVIIESSSGTTQTVRLAAIPAGSTLISGGSTGGSTSGETNEETSQTTEGESASETTTTEPTEAESTDGAVLGSATETFMSFLSRFGLPIGVGLIVLAGLYIIFFGKRNEK